MLYNQRDVVFVREELPDGKLEEHPFLIISCKAANEKESYYTGVMMTASAHTDHFTFPLHDLMFERPLAKKNCQLRLYILVSFPEKKIRSFFNRMKKVDFKAVLEQIKNYVLSMDQAS